MVAVGVERPIRADDDGGLHAVHGGAAVAARVGQVVFVDVGVERGNAHRHGSALGNKAALVQGRVAVVGVVRWRGLAIGRLASGVVRGVAGLALAVDGVDRPEQAPDLRLVVGAQVVAGAVRNAQGDEAVAARVEAVVLGVVEQGESAAGGGAAQAALGLHLLAQRVQGLHLAQRQVLALGGVFVGVGIGAGAMASRRIPLTPTRYETRPRLIPLCVLDLRGTMTLPINVLRRSTTTGLIVCAAAVLAACEARSGSQPLTLEAQARVDALAKKSLTRLSYVQAGGFWLGDVGVLMTDKLKQSGTVLGPDAKPQDNPYYTFGDDNKPPRWVTLDAFSMQQLKVTYGDFDVYVAANGLPKHPPEGDEKFQRIWRRARTGDDVPVGVNWQQAKDYCLWLGKVTGQPFDLPTEAQWEFAASNGRKTHWEPLPTDNGIREEGRNHPSYEQKRALIGPDGALYPVARFPPSKLKLNDLVGDGFEWTQDWYAANEYQTMKDTHNPKGPLSGTEKVLRGYPTNEDMGGFPHSIRYHEVPVGIKLDDKPWAYYEQSIRCIVDDPKPVPGTYSDGPGPVVNPFKNKKP